MFSCGLCAIPCPAPRLTQGWQPEPSCSISSPQPSLFPAGGHRLPLWPSWLHSRKPRQAPQAASPLPWAPHFFCPWVPRRKAPGDAPRWLVNQIPLAAATGRKKSEPTLLLPTTSLLMKGSLLCKASLPNLRLPAPGDTGVTHLLQLFAEQACGQPEVGPPPSQGLLRVELL